MSDNQLSYADSSSGYSGLVSVFNSNMEILNKYISLDMSARITYGTTEPVYNSDTRELDLYFQMTLGSEVVVYLAGIDNWIPMATLPDINKVDDQLTNYTYIYDGIGVPPKNLGNKGDLYINLDNSNQSGDLYRRTQYAWLLIGNIRGSQGIQGEKGLQGERGIQGNPGVQGEKGDTGDTGTRGSMWFDGQGQPAISLGLVGDHYLQLDDPRKPLFVKSSDLTWERLTFMAHSNVSGSGATDLVFENRVQLETVDTINLPYGTEAYVEHSDVDGKLPGLYYWSSVGWLPGSSCDLSLSRKDVVGIVANMIKYKVDRDPHRGFSTNDLTDELLAKIECQGLVRDPEDGELFELEDAPKMSLACEFIHQLVKGGGE